MSGSDANFNWEFPLEVWFPLDRAITDKEVDEAIVELKHIACEDGWCDSLALQTEISTLRFAVRDHNARHQERIAKSPWLKRARLEV